MRATKDDRLQAERDSAAISPVAHRFDTAEQAGHNASQHCCEGCGLTVYTRPITEVDRYGHVSRRFVAYFMRGDLFDGWWE